MKTTLVGFVVVVAGLCAAVRIDAQTDPQSPVAYFQSANASYEAGDYTRAIEDYTRVAQTGVAHPDLYYNLGNAYFKVGNLGRAVLWYERARRLAPRDSDVRENLELTRSLLRDQQLVTHEPRWRNLMVSWHRNTTTAESAALALAFYLLGCLVTMLIVFRDTEAVTRFYGQLSVLSPGRLLGLDKTQDLGIALAIVLLVGGAFGTSALSKARAERSRTSGVVVADEVSVFSGPSHDALVQFKVHEGTVVDVRDARPGWVRVDLPGDLGGWMDEASLDRI